MSNNTEASVIIRGTGSYTPSNIVTNEDLTKIVDTSDEWIRTRSGIKQRNIAKDENTSDMASKAGLNAIRNAGLEPKDIDLIVVATITPDTLFPSAACSVQTKLGLTDIPAFDLSAACSGFIYGLEVVKCMLTAKRFKNILLIGAEKLSSIVNWEDRTTCVLFGDGAGAAVLSLSEEENVGVLGTIMGANGAEKDILCQPGGGSDIPATIESVEQKKHFLYMQGNQVFKSAVRAMEQCAVDILEKHNISADDIDLIVPHQANIRIIESLSQRLKVGLDRIMVNLDKNGNTSAASIPLALDDAVKEGRIKSGDTVLLVAFGAGLTWASALIKWQ